jgi:hypothetical protein
MSALEGESLEGIGERVVSQTLHIAGLSVAIVPNVRDREGACHSEVSRHVV